MPVGPLANALSFNTGGAIQTVGFLMLGLFLIIGAAVGSFFLYTTVFSKLRYTYPVEIYYQEKGMRSPIRKNDKGGIFVNRKTNLKRFYLFKHNVGLDPDNVPFIFNERGKKIVTLWQTGIKSFRYSMPAIDENPGFVMHVGDEDVNWALATFREWKERFTQKTFLEQYGHMILWAITIVGTLFLFFFVAQKFDVLAQTATSLQNAAEAVRDARLGTIVE